MKSTTVALGLLSGLASASVQHPRQFHQYFRRDNSTAYPTEGPSTTLTVDITTTKTITSCAPTVTNCPIRGNNGTAVVTEVINLTTTVCPVSEAGSVSSSVVAGHNSGLIPGSTSTLEPTGGYPTAYPSVGTTEEVLSVTVGPTSSQSVLVTTIQSTYTTWQTLTTPAPSGGAEGAEPTTTTTLTSTGTRYLTVKPNEGRSISPETVGGGSGSGAGGDCTAVTVTVTETEAVSTVYVTQTGPSGSTPTGGSEGSDNSGSSGEGSDNSGEGSSEEGDDEEEGDYEEGDDEYENEDDCPPEESDTIIDVTQTVSPIPYPTGNGTVPTFPTGTGSPSSSLTTALTSASSTAPASAPATDVPSTDSPATEYPTTEYPAGDYPATEYPAAYPTVAYRM
jgi:hypothetical protein